MYPQLLYTTAILWGTQQRPDGTFTYDLATMVNGDIGLIPLFTEFENVVTRENVQGDVSYPDGIPFLAKLSLA